MDLTRHTSVRHHGTTFPQAPYAFSGARPIFLDIGRFASNRSTQTEPPEQAELFGCPPRVQSAPQLHRLRPARRTVDQIDLFLWIVA